MIRISLLVLVCVVFIGCGGGGGGSDDPPTLAPVTPPLEQPDSAAISRASLAEVLEDSASPGGAENANGVAVTAAQLDSIAGIVAIAAANEPAYQAAILAEKNFSNPVSTVQLQAIVNSVNAFNAVASAVASGDTSGITVAQLQAVEGLQGTQPRLQSLYQQGLSALSPDTLKSTGQLQFVVSVVNGDDHDGDGLSNLEEALGFTLRIGPDTRVVFPNPESADTDGDGLQDGYELYHSLGNTASGLNVVPADSNRDSVAGTQRDAVIAAANGVPGRARGGLIDQDGDGLPRDSGIPWYDGAGWQFVSSDPVNPDSDGDNLYDGAEAGIQLTFRLYRGFDRTAAIRLLAQLNPTQATTLAVGAVNYPTELSLERDSDGGGRADIEEWWAGTNPGQAIDDKPYRGCADAGLPDPNGNRGSCTETATWAAMTAANFRFVPGGFDVNGDGVIETGFWLSQFEARDANAGQASDPQPGVGGSSLAAYLSFNFRVFNPNSGQFDQRVCEDGGYSPDRNIDGITSPGTIPAGCRQTEYPKLGWNVRNNPSASGAAITSPRLAFTPTRLPLTATSSVEASIGLADSAVASVALSLPDAIDWMQVVALVMHDERNWTNPNGNGIADIADGEIFRGHTDNQNRLGAAATPLAVTAANPDDFQQGYDGTGDGDEFNTFPDSSNDIDQRRTLVLANGTAARDFELPLNHAVVIWDLAGNVWEWTRGLVAARSEASITGNRAGGDRFLGGDAGWVEFDALALAARSMPDWWKPILPHAEGRVLNSSNGAGSYFDGFSARGAAYLQGSEYGSDYASVRRGGHWGNSGNREFSGIATTILESGPDDRRVGIGFRAVGRR
jgi:hypothetical protein